MSQFKARALTALLTYFARMSTPKRLCIGAALGRLVYRAAASRMHIVRTNLALCFPDTAAEVREQWVRQHARALAQSYVDRGVLWFGSRQDIEALVQVHGLEHIERVRRDKQPLLLLAPHFIGLDAAATALTLYVTPSATMYTPQRDAAIDAVMNRGRARFGDVELVSRRDGVRGLIRHLRSGRTVYYLPDMDFGREGAIFAPFFGIQAATIPATAQIARKWDVAVVPVIEHWDPATGRYHVHVLPPLADFPGGQTIEEATARLNLEIESWVRRWPTQYYWVHRRFKTRPAGEKKIY